MSHNPLQDSPSQLNFPEVWNGSRISSEIAEHFCLFQTGDTTKMLYAHNRSNATSGIVWTAGLPGHRRTNWVSSAQKILFSSLVVLWSPRGLPLPSWTTLWMRKSLWLPERSITVERVLFGRISGEAYYTTIVVSSTSVPHATFSRQALMFFRSSMESRNPAWLRINVSSSGAFE